MSVLVLCELCDLTISLYSCQECDLSLCQLCKQQLHQPNKMKHHHIYQISNNNPKHFDSTSSVTVERSAISHADRSKANMDTNNKLNNNNTMIYANIRRDVDNKSAYCCLCDSSVMSIWCIDCDNGYCELNGCDIEYHSVNKYKNHKRNNIRIKPNLSNETISNDYESKNDSLVNDNFQSVQTNHGSLLKSSISSRPATTTATATVIQSVSTPTPSNSFSSSVMDITSISTPSHSYSSSTASSLLSRLSLISHSQPQTLPLPLPLPVPVPTAVPLASTATPIASQQSAYSRSSSIQSISTFPMKKSRSQSSLNQESKLSSFNPNVGTTPTQFTPNTTTNTDAILYDPSLSSSLSSPIPSASSVELCELCEKVPPVVYCGECKLLLCYSNCCDQEVHKPSKLKSHKRQLINNLSANKSFSASPPQQQQHEQQHYQSESEQGGRTKPVHYSTSLIKSAASLDRESSSPLSLKDAGGGPLISTPSLESFSTYQSIIKRISYLEEQLNKQQEIMKQHQQQEQQKLVSNTGIDDHINSPEFSTKQILNHGLRSDNTLPVQLLQSHPLSNDQDLIVDPLQQSSNQQTQHEYQEMHQYHQTDESSLLTFHKNKSIKEEISEKMKLQQNNNSNTTATKENNSPFLSTLSKDASIIMDELIQVLTPILNKKSIQIRNEEVKNLRTTRKKNLSNNSIEIDINIEDQQAHYQYNEGNNNVEIYDCPNNDTNSNNYDDNYEINDKHNNDKGISVSDYVTKSIVKPTLPTLKFEQKEPLQDNIDQRNSSRPKSPHHSTKQYDSTKTHHQEVVNHVVYPQSSYSHPLSASPSNTLIIGMSSQKSSFNSLPLRSSSSDNFDIQKKECSGERSFTSLLLRSYRDQAKRISSIRKNNKSLLND